MRWTRWTALFAVAAATAVALYSCTPATQTETAKPAAASAQDKVARGRYLVLTMGCGDCHTPGTFYGQPDTTRSLSGSDLGWVGPWGVVHAHNLTPDSTGIGSWSEEQIVAALRTGIRPDGRQLAPIMPWMNYAHLTDEDAASIAAYLKTLPPVAHENQPPIPPGEKPTGALITFPPPPAWDGQHLAPPPVAK